MFKCIEIQISGPVCSCKAQNIAWSITEGPGLSLRCKTCNTELRIPREKFVAHYKLDKPYPADLLKDTDEGGKVIPFDQKDKN